MFEFTLIAAVLFFGTSSIIMAIVLFEAYRPETFRILRRWRYAFSKRKTIGQMQRSAINARREADSARRAADEADERSIRAKIDAEGEVANAKSVADDRIGQANKRINDSEHQSRIRIAQMGSYIIAEQSGEHIKAIRANNYKAKEKKILKSVKKAEDNGYSLPQDERKQLARMLKQAHEAAIKAETEKQRQAEIKAQIREEEKRQREIDKAIRDAEKEEKLKRRALEEAIKLLGDTHSEQLEQLKAELADAEAKMQRTMSMAQQTKAGHIYVISNIGSFGRDVFKVGMTRRLEPMDRVRELGDASVPFGFDVHAMISSDDAPALEAALHRELNDYRVNKVNLRKEYFRTDINQIINAVATHHGEVQYQIDPEALEYFESLESSEDWDGEEIANV